MQNLESVGFVVRVIQTAQDGNTSKRLELRMAQDNAYVASFYIGTRQSLGETKSGMATDMICRDKLSAMQIRAVKSWLREQVILHID